MLLVYIFIAWSAITLLINSISKWARENKEISPEKWQQIAKVFKNGAE